MPIPIGTEVTASDTKGGERRTLWTVETYNAKVIMAYQQTDGAKGVRCIMASDEPLSGISHHSYTYQDKTVYYMSAVWLNVFYDVEPVIYGYGSTLSNTAGEIAWTMIYGEIHGGAEITVIWVRPEDEKELTDKFEISVDSPPIPPVSGGDSGGGGSSGGSW